MLVSCPQTIFTIWTPRLNAFVMKINVNGHDTMAVQPILDGHWLDKGMTGPSPESNFYNQELGTLKAFEYAINGIDSSGNPTHGPLLLVTTYPSGYDVNKQGALWGYKICSGSPELIFAVSLGAGVSSNSPNIDCRNGVIAVGRLVSSVALIDINAAISGPLGTQSCRLRFWICGRRGTTSNSAIRPKFDNKLIKQ